MLRLGFLFLLLIGWAALLPFSGCTRPPDSSNLNSAPTNALPAPTNRDSRVYHLDHAQPTLRSLTLYMGRKEITAEIAASRTEIATGMMFGKSMGKDEGMLFVFPMAHQTGFYMKNTIIPLSVAYIDREGAILEINDLEPLDEEPVIAKTDQVQYVLEMNRGWFRANQIGVGTVITAKNGTLRETFFPRQF